MVDRVDESRHACAVASPRPCLRAALHGGPTTGTIIRKRRWLKCPEIPITVYLEVHRASMHSILSIMHHIGRARILHRALGAARRRPVMSVALAVVSAILAGIALTFLCRGPVDVSTSLRVTVYSGGRISVSNMVIDNASDCAAIREGISRASKEWALPSLITYAPTTVVRSTDWELMFVPHAVVLSRRLCGGTVWYQSERIRKPEDGELERRIRAAAHVPP